MTASEKYDQSNIEILMKKINNIEVLTKKLEVIENRVEKTEKKIDNIVGWFWPILIGVGIGVVFGWFTG